MILYLPEGFFDTKPVHKIGSLFELESVNLDKLYFSNQTSESKPLSQAFERHGISIDAYLVPLGIPDLNGSILTWRPFVVVWGLPHTGRWRAYGRTMSFNFDLADKFLQPGDSVAVPRDLLPVLADEFFDALFQSGCCELVPSPTRLDVLQFV